jgi:hypothetical protein
MAFIDKSIAILFRIWYNKKYKQPDTWLEEKETYDARKGVCYEIQGNGRDSRTKRQQLRDSAERSSARMSGAGRRDHND